MALRDRQILAYLRQFGSDVAEAVFDIVKAYREGLAQGARRVLKGHILKGSIIDYWLNMYVMVLPDGVFQQRANTWKSLRLNWTLRERRLWERTEWKRSHTPGISWRKYRAKQWGSKYRGL